MARERFIKTKSNYVIKELHQSTNNGNIYERDFMTISDLNSYAPGSLPAYGLNGFKMVLNDTLNLKKKHHYGKWLKNEGCEGKPMYWTLQCMTDEDNLASNASALKPNLNSVLDFACYGSASKMIESAVKNIITTYPGELYLTGKKVDIDGIKYYIVDNPFNIEMDKYPNMEGENYTTKRVFSEIYNDYQFVNEYDEPSPVNLSWDAKFFGSGIYIDENGEIKKKCLTENSRVSIINLGIPFEEDDLEIVLYYIIYDGKKTLFHDGSYIGGRITPKNKVKKEYFSNLKDFEKVLLNKKTNYTAILDTPKETDYGNVMYKKSYAWPKAHYGDWNIDVSSHRFYNYFSDVLAIGEFYDKNFSNSLWRAMTHEAIVNFDWTLTRTDNNGDGEVDDTPHSERIESFIHVAGRMFDDLKQYIDGIANVNAVTYNECGNKPDEFLSEELENYGWSVKAPLSYQLSKFISKILYPSHSDGYTIDEANYEFYRRLLLNSRAILSAKGTKKSIEMMMSLFGYYSRNFIEHSYHEVMRDGKLTMLKWNNLTEDEQKKILTYSYDMSEYVYVAGEGSNIWDETAIEHVKAMNKRKFNYDFSDKDEYQGLPLREVTVTTDDKNSFIWDEVTGEYISGYTRYLIPWFDKNKAKNNDYDTNIYFESKGGWGLKQTAVIETDDDNLPFIDTTSDMKIYDETVKYLKFVQTLDELKYVEYRKPQVNDVYYVYDLTGFDTQYNSIDLTVKKDNDILKYPLEEKSHYFILKNIDRIDVLGCVKDIKGNPVLLDENVEYDEKGIITNIDELHKLDELGFPQTLMGWKNVSVEELTRRESIDAKRVLYLENIIENHEGNNPHVGYGAYDEGNEFKDFFADVFKGAKQNDNFINVDDNEVFTYGFNLEKQIDNVKTWYFSDTLNQDKTLLSLDVNNITDNSEEFVPEYFTDATTIVGATNNFVRGTNMNNGNGEAVDGLFNNKQYKTMTPYNMEGADGDISDEAAANSIINSKQFYIEFIPDVSSPQGMYDFIENVVMHYVKQVIPSTTILKYYVPLTQQDINCYNRTYIQSAIITE